MSLDSCDFVVCEAHVTSYIFFCTTVFFLEVLEKRLHGSMARRGMRFNTGEMVAIMSYRQVNILRAASLFEANKGSLANLAMIISRAGSRPTRVRA